jgi:tRNA A-37 threonylcarbamoyl transferase component Bud32
MTEPSQATRSGGDATPPTTELMAGSVVGEYRVERKLGQGAMGSVYAAVHTVLGKRVALKVISAALSRDADAIARFHREARILAQLESPHIVDVFGFGALQDGRAYFVMEYLTGEPLSSLLARGRVPLDDALEIIEQIARSLDAPHAAGVVHRDLKPDNIFIERRDGAPLVKLLDFGVVKIAKQDDGIAKTRAGVLVGTPLYAAPEQLSSASEVDHRADIYALGGVAFELVLGRVPFPCTTIVEIVAAQLTSPPPQPRTIWSAIPAALDSLLPAMLAKDPAKRPTLGHVEETIDKLRQSAFALVSRPETLSGKQRGKPARRYRLVVAALAAVLGSVIAVVVARGDREPTRPTTQARTVDDVGVRVAPIATPIVSDTQAPGSASPAVLVPAIKPSGALDLSTKPPCNVSIDGKPTGRRTPIVALSMSAGTHRVTFENAQLGITKTVDVRVVSGQLVRVVENYLPSAPHVDPNGTIDPFGSKGSGR